MKNLLLFCGSSTGNDPEIVEMAKNLGKYLAEHKYRLIYGGGNVGLMGIIANSVMQNGGEVIGIIPEFLMVREVGHVEVTEFYVVKSMHERKALMCDKADLILAIPGGFGTFDELFEMLTWLQLGLHSKPIGLLNYKGFFDLLLKQLDLMVEKGFLRPSNKELILVNESYEALLNTLSKIKIEPDTKWFTDRNLS
jgi:uncharacterized protein (TIGR00730 family)